MNRRPYILALFFFLLLSITNVYAQKIFHLDGYMGVQGGESFHYNLDLRDSTQNILTGYSYTFSTQENIVKSSVIAEIDREKKTLHIQEQGIIYNKGFVSKAVICLVDASLKWDEQAGDLSGSLITQTSNNGATCSTGSISFIKETQIQELFSLQKSIVSVAELKEQTSYSNFQTRVDPNQKLHNYFQHKEQKQKDTTVVKPVAVQTELEKTKKITEGAAGVYNWHSDKVVFEIWDGGEIDNDQVTIFFNGKAVLMNYTLTAEKKRLVFELSKRSPNTITILADNEGVIPPNTANILLYDGTEPYSILAYNTTEKKAIIKIKRTNK